MEWLELCLVKENQGSFSTGMFCEIAIVALIAWVDDRFERTCRIWSLQQCVPVVPIVSATALSRDSHVAVMMISYTVPGSNSVRL